MSVWPIFSGEGRRDGTFILAVKQWKITCQVLEFRSERRNKLYKSTYLQGLVMSVSWIYCTYFKKAQDKMLLIYLSGTILLVGLKNVEQVGLDLWESESDTVNDNKD